MIAAGLGSLDPNVLPLDAFDLSGAEGDTQRLISLKDPWYLDGERVSYPQTGFVSGRGWWQKHADGTLIQVYYDPVLYTATTLQGSVYQTAPIQYSFPIPFLGGSLPAVALGAWGFSVASWCGYAGLAGDVVRLYGFCGTSGGTMKLSYIAIGRWKA